jgi:hypothetical protein
MMNVFPALATAERHRGVGADGALVTGVSDESRR